MYVCYCLLDPRDTSVRYCGQTSDIVERFIVHLRCGEVNRQKNEWILELRSLGLVPICRTLQVCLSEREARQAERKWIEAFIEIGEPLFNSEVTGKR